jgi:hypothetical protein
MDIKTILTIISILVIVLVARVLENHIQNRKNPIKSETQYRYQKKYYFFTKNELYFYKHLLSITSKHNITIFAKPRLADIIEPEKNSKNWNASFAKIKSKHVDFLLCENPQIKPLLVIELDDKSHDTEKGQQRDKFVDEALEKCGIKTLRMRGTQELEEKLLQKITQKQS